MICTNTSLFSENVEKFVHIIHTTIESSRSVIIRPDEIIIKSMEWAHEILTHVNTIQQLEIIQLNVTFVDGRIHADDTLVTEILQLIVTECSDSLIVLELRGLNLQFFDIMLNFRPNRFDPLFPNLRDIALVKTVINRDILLIFSHTAILQLLNPSSMNFGNNGFGKIASIGREMVMSMGLKVPDHFISYPNLISVVVSFNNSNAIFSGDIILPIYPQVLESIEIYYRHPIPDDCFVKIYSPENLRIFKIVGGKNYFDEKILRKRYLHDALEYLEVPLDESVKKRKLKRFICDGNLAGFEFILNRLSNKEPIEARKFAHNNEIICKNKGIIYDVKRTVNKGPYILYSGHERVSKEIDEEDSSAEKFD